MGTGNTLYSKILTYLPCQVLLIYWVLKKYITVGAASAIINPSSVYGPGQQYSREQNYQDLQRRTPNQHLVITVNHCPIIQHTFLLSNIYPRSRSRAGPNLTSSFTIFTFLCPSSFLLFMFIKENKGLVEYSLFVLSLPNSTEIYHYQSLAL